MIAFAFSFLFFYKQYTYLVEYGFTYQGFEVPGYGIYDSIIAELERYNRTFRESR